MTPEVATIVCCTILLYTSSSRDRLIHDFYAQTHFVANTRVQLDACRVLRQAKREPGLVTRGKLISLNRPQPSGENNMLVSLVLIEGENVSEDTLRSVSLSNALQLVIGNVSGFGILTRNRLRILVMPCETSQIFRA